MNKANIDLEAMATAMDRPTPSQTPASRQGARAVNHSGALALVTRLEETVSNLRSIEHRLDIAIDELGGEVPATAAAEPSVSTGPTGAIPKAHASVQELVDIENRMVKLLDRLQSIITD